MTSEFGFGQNWHCGFRLAIGLLRSCDTGSLPQRNTPPRSQSAESRNYTRGWRWILLWIDASNTCRSTISSPRHGTDAGATITVHATDTTVDDVVAEGPRVTTDPVACRGRVNGGDNPPPD